MANHVPGRPSNVGRAIAATQEAPGGADLVSDGSRVVRGEIGPSGGNVVAFTVIGAPVPKARPRMSRSGHTYTDARTVAYERLVRDAAIRAAMPHGRLPVFMKGAPVKLTIRVYRAASRGDLDNYSKAVSDACNRILYEDDRQVVSLDAWMGVDRENPRVEVEVCAI